jgi:tetratricopeptide (TPR) repeat protein
LWLAAASLAYGLAVGARPSLLFGAVILLAPVAAAWREKGPVWPLWLAAGGPIVLIGLGLMVYNALRFGNPLEFGQHYQLAAVRPDTTVQFSPRYLWFNFRVCFLEPARWSVRFPYVGDILAPSLPAGGGKPERPFGVLTNVPLVWLALAAPLAWRDRLAEGRWALRWFLGAVTLLFGVCALGIGLHDSMCLRYEVEFAHVLVLLGVVGIFGLERALAGQPAWRRAARCVWVLLLAFSVAFNLFACLNSRAEIQNALGDDLAKQGQPHEAMAHFQKALEIEPSYADARLNLGVALAITGDLEEAAAQIRASLKTNPGNAVARNDLGNVLLAKGELQDAIAQYQEALAIQPDLVMARDNLGKALLRIGVVLSQTGRTHEAVASWQQALETAPDQADVQINLAWALATASDASLRNGAKAVALATRANQLRGGGDPPALRALAAAYAEEGSYGLAAVTARNALELAVAQKNDALAAALQQEIKLYEADKPMRDGTTAGSAPTGRDGTTQGSETEQHKEAPQRGELRRNDEATQNHNPK